MDADRRKQNDLSRANIVRTQVIFLCSTLNDDNWEEKLQELKKVTTSPPYQKFAFADPHCSWRRNPVSKFTLLNCASSSKLAPPVYFKGEMVLKIQPDSFFAFFL